MSYAVVTTPTERTIDRLNDILSSAPLSIPLSDLYVLLWSGPVAPSSLKSPGGPYSAKFTEFKTSYGTLQDHPELAGVLDSPEMRARATELGSPLDFPLRLIFLNHPPPLSRTIRTFLVSVADTLVSKEFEPFTFNQDILLQV